MPFFSKFVQKAICILIIAIFAATNNAYSFSINTKNTLRLPLQTEIEETTQRFYPLEVMDTNYDLTQAVNALEDDKIGIKRVLIAYCMEHPEEENYALEIAKEKNIPLGLTTERLKYFVDANGHISIVAADQGTFIEWAGGNKEVPSELAIGRATLFRLKMLYYYASRVKAAGNTSIGFLTDFPAFSSLQNIGEYNVDGLIEDEFLPADFSRVVKDVPLVMQMEDTQGKRGVEYKDLEKTIFHTAKRRDNITVEHAKHLGAKMVKSNIFLYAGETLKEAEEEFNKRQWKFVKELAKEAKHENMPYVSEVLFMPCLEKSKDKAYTESKEYLIAHAAATIETAKIMNEIDGITLCKLAHPYPGQVGWNNATQAKRQSKLKELKEIIGNKWLILSAGEDMETFDLKVSEAAIHGGAVGMLVGRSPIKNVVAKDAVGIDRLKDDAEVIRILKTSAQDKMRNLISHFDSTHTSIWKIMPKDNPFYNALHIHPNREILGTEAGDEAWSRILNLLNSTDRDISIVLASAPSQLEFLHSLALNIEDAYNDGEISIEQLARIHIFHLDQYAGLLDKPEKYHDKCDFAKFLEREFFDLLPEAVTNALNFHPIKQTPKGLQGPALLDAAKRECNRYYQENILPIVGQNNGNFDIVVFGIGDEESHIAFVEPENADITNQEALIPVQVHPAQQVSDGMFDKIEDVPEWAYTMTLDRMIIRSDFMLGVIPTGTKADSLKEMLAKITPKAPSSFTGIRKDHSISIHVTENSARKLPMNLLIQYESKENAQKILESAIKAQKRFKNAVEKNTKVLSNITPYLPDNFENILSEHYPEITKENLNSTSLNILKALTDVYSMFYAAYYNAKDLNEVKDKAPLYFLGDDVENNLLKFQSLYTASHQLIVIAKDNEQKNKLDVLKDSTTPKNLKIVLLKDVFPFRAFDFKSVMNEKGYGIKNYPNMRFITDKEIKDSLREISAVSGFMIKHFNENIRSI